MTLSESLYKLAGRAKEAEQKAERAQHRAAEDFQGARADLEKEINEARVSAETQAKHLRESAKASPDMVMWDQQQEAWNSHVAKVRNDIEGKKAELEGKKFELDVKKAKRHADHAERDAAWAIDYAYAALEEADYSVLRAIVARANAEDLASSA